MNKLLEQAILEMEQLKWPTELSMKARFQNVAIDECIAILKEKII